MNDKFFVTDCEGPLSVNDNAYEISDYFIPDGGIFFKILSEYDDILVERNTKGYLAGSTLRLISPFLKAYDLTEQDIIDFSEDNIFLIPGAKSMIQITKEIMPCYIVSTSYNQYIKALCDNINFSYENTYSTELNLDKFDLDEIEQDRLLEMHDTILFDSSFENIDQIFHNTIYSMKINKLIESIKPVGGVGKRDAILDIIEKQKYKPENLMYSGDSITDKEALEYAKESNGVSISFNGNKHSINSASISILSNNNMILALMAEIFNNSGTEGVYEFIMDYNEDPFNSINEYSTNNTIKQELIMNKMPIIDIINNKNRDNVINKAQKIRNSVRGEKIGNLG